MPAAVGMGVAHGLLVLAAALVAVTLGGAIAVAAAVRAAGVGADEAARERERGDDREQEGTAHGGWSLERGGRSQHSARVAAQARAALSVMAGTS